MLGLLVMLLSDFDKPCPIQIFCSESGFLLEVQCRVALLETWSAGVTRTLWSMASCLLATSSTADALDVLSLPWEASSTPLSVFTTLTCV